MSLSKAVSTGATISILLTLLSSAAEALGSGSASHDTWAPAHIDSLPQEIRRGLGRWRKTCGELKARHEFSRYMSYAGQHFVSLHFEHLGCENREVVCTFDSCLHQVYASSRAGYRLVFEARVPDVELKLVDGAPALEISCANTTRTCPRVLRWIGRRFEPLRR